MMSWSYGLRCSSFDDTFDSVRSGLGRASPKLVSVGQKGVAQLGMVDRSVNLTNSLAPMSPLAQYETHALG
jgi:hypothetical protein